MDTKKIIKKLLLDNWKNKFGSFGSIPTQISLKQVDSQRQIQKELQYQKIIYSISFDEATPALFVKIMNNDSNQVENQITFSQKQTTTNRLLFPKVYFNTRHEDKFFIFEEAIEGENLLETIEKNPSDIQALLNKIYSILSKISFKEIEKSKYNNEIKSQINEFISNLDPSNDQHVLLKKNLSKFNIPHKGIHYRQRFYNFDFIHDNIIINKEQIRFLDIEFLKESTMYFVEPIRLIYYLFSELIKLEIIEKHEDNLNFVSLITDPKHILRDSLKNNFPEIQAHFKKFIIIFLIIENNLQKKVNSSVYNQNRDNFICHIDHYVILLNICFDPIKYINNLVQDKTKFTDQLEKHIQVINNRMEMIEKSKAYKLSTGIRKIIKRE